MIEVAIAFTLFMLIYFTLHVLLFSHFRKKINISLFFNRSIIFMDFLASALLMITLMIFNIFPKSHNIIIEIYLTSKQHLILILLTVQTIYHVVIQILFQKTKIAKSAYTILNSSILAYVLTSLCILISTTILKIG